MKSPSDDPAAPRCSRACGSASDGYIIARSTDAPRVYRCTLRDLEHALRSDPTRVVFIVERGLCGGCSVETTAAGIAARDATERGER